MENQWVHTNSVFRMREVSQQLDALPRAVYKLQEDRFGFFLAEVDKEFSLPEKIYGLQRPFISRVKKSWQETTGNMGILLNGIRGTGKTVTAEVIANEMNLPVIIIAQQFEGNMIDFINELSDDCVIFFDEYDKIFEKYSSTLLTVMDGVLKRDTRIMFLLTTNDDHLNDNMYQRPSRIRYINTFGNLDPDVVIEVVDDCLTAVQYREETIRFISELSIITIDLVKSIIQEVNIHQESPYVFRDVFNITGNEKTYEVTEIDENDKETVLFQRATIDDFMSVPFTFSDIGSSLYINGSYIGTIKDIINPSTVDVAKKDHLKNDEDDDKVVHRKLSFKVQSRKHYSFIERGL
jgi:DNA-directed RNA polymerase subunit F